MRAATCALIRKKVRATSITETGTAATRADSKIEPSGS